MSFTIKKLTPTDLHLAKSIIAVWQVENGIDAPMPDDEYLADLLAKDSFHFYVAMQDELIIGGLTAYEMPMYTEQVTEMFLYEIDVVESYQRQGVATMLIDALKQTCLSKRIKTIYVGTESNNEPAKKLYKATGGAFEEIAWFVYEL